MRKIPFVNNEYYHIFNRGADKRIVFCNRIDVERFLQSMQEFNSTKPIGSIYENSFVKTKYGQLGGRTAKLVEIVAYCLNPNHFHLILKQKKDGGVSEFMKRLGGGYAWYFNNAHNRSGVLFQGRFKAVHISSNEQLLHLSAYVNLNDKVHQLGGPAAKLVRSSWEEYLGEGELQICNKEIILEQFKNFDEYKNFASDSLKTILESKKLLKEFGIDR